MKKTVLKAVLSFYLIVLISSSLFAEKRQPQTYSDKIIGDWKLSKLITGENDHGISTQKVTQSISFDPKGYYECEFGQKEYNGYWNVVDSIGMLELLREGGRTPKTLKVIKCNKVELVLQSDNQVFVFVSKDYKVAGIDRYRGVLGIIALIFLAFLFSNNKKGINWRIIGAGLLLQITIALLLKVHLVEMVFNGVAKFFTQLLNFTNMGSEFIFGEQLMDSNKFGVIFAVQILPTVIFFSALTSVLYYFGILQKIVWLFAVVMRKIMRLSGAESLAAAANIFIGQTEAPLVVKPYLVKMTRSEIMALMTGGMATIAGGVLAAYIRFLGGEDPVQQAMFAKHLLTASIMNAPAALLVAKILIPETKEINKDLSISKEVIGSNVLDALSKGTTDGLKLAVNVGAMLLVFTAMIHMVNYAFLNWIGQPTGLNDYIINVSGGQYEGLTMQYILGFIFAPIAWLIGIPSQDLVAVGQMLGEKMILNEFIAYKSLSDLKTAFLLTDQKTILISTYALCGFANFASIGIQIGGIGALAPNQRVTLSQLGVKAVIGGTIATLLTASIAGMIL